MRGKGHRHAHVVKVGKQTGGGRNRVRAGRTEQGMRASWQEGAGIGGGQGDRGGRQGWKNEKGARCTEGGS